MTGCGPRTLQRQHEGAWESGLPQGRAHVVLQCRLLGRLLDLRRHLTGQKVTQKLPQGLHWLCAWCASGRQGADPEHNSPGADSASTLCVGGCIRQPGLWSCCLPHRSTMHTINWHFAVRLKEYCMTVCCKLMLQTQRCAALLHIIKHSCTHLVMGQYAQMLCGLIDTMCSELLLS